MAQIRPFRGTRYSASAGPLESLVAPPYDVLSEAEREEYASKNPRNIVHLTLPEKLSDDRSKFVKYARSAARLAEWRREGSLAAEKSPCFYRYAQSFPVPDEAGTRTRSSLIALLKTEPYEAGVVLPHEETFPKHKEDRLRLLEATRAHLECIYGLCEDEGAFLGCIEAAKGKLLAELTTHDGVTHRLESIDGAADVKRLIGECEGKKIWIADGHHRYETARAFREAVGKKKGVIAEDFIVMALSSIVDPGLVILPTHRIVPKLSVLPTQLENLFQTHFNVRKVTNGRLAAEVRGLAAPDTRAFGVALPTGFGLVLTLEEPLLAARWIDAERSDLWKTLDVSILHHLIFDKLLGMRGTDFCTYTRDANGAIEAVRKGADAAFLMNPTSVYEMRYVALGGEKMPQKSTYYFPKLLSGLVLWSLEDL